MSINLMLVAVLFFITAALHLATPFIYGRNTETIGIGVFGLTYLVLGFLTLTNLPLVPFAALMITGIGTFGAVKSFDQNVALQKITRIFIGIDIAILGLLIFFFVSQW